MGSKPDNTLFLLGKYLGLVFLLPSGALAGYLLGAFAAHWVDWPGVRGLGIVVGLIASLVKLVQELLRDAERNETPGTKL